ncbi:MAG TPA: bifunctional pyr operon transcriptional regulator/uracil phosphoribosyltransferase PyrR [Burkholderiales bacterium]|nr:bifunctional pyr operon transcriptional regulator/uracil phosphoribosyltransferase PyrR [Burkholderiales bacterium]
MKTRVPDAESLLAALIEQMRPAVPADTGMIGIHTGGVWVAQRLHRALGLTAPLGTIDVAFYRDDYGSRGLSPKVRPSDIPFDVTDRDIVLVDDVLYTGRTIRAAINELFDYGRPGRVRLAALVDRGGRQLPIAPQFVGSTLEVADGELVVLSRAEDGRLSLSVQARVGAGA